MTIEHLSFGYSKRKNRVLNDCSLRLDEGKIYGLLGKNGVGKSTLLYLMTGLLTPTEGHACLNGTDVRLRRPDTLSDFFLIPEEFDLPDYNLKKYVRLNASFYPHFDHENLLRNLEMFELPEDIKLGELSMGPRQKPIPQTPHPRNERIARYRDFHPSGARCGTTSRPRGHLG